MGFHFRSKSGTINSMPLPVTSCLMAVLIPATLPQNLTGSPSERHLALVPIHASPVPTEDSAFTQSLRKDIATHPGDFLVFASEATADRFLLSHTDAHAETDRRVLERGIKGYWQGKILVVLANQQN